MPAFFRARRMNAIIVGGTAAAACLRHDDCSFVQVIFAGKKSIHDLSHNHQGRIAGIVVYIFKTHINSMLVVVGEDFQVIAGCFKSSLKDSEVEWRHLRAENGVLLTHLLGKGYLLDGSRLDVPFLFCACLHG